ncbi:hypothetical protein CRG98_001485 [Punica granatum]|uniref:Uncharacterized protein n=1 Tax=Punica granatum TaxID=22663 RepID=A0A2I0LBV3_PUNGR|nr:hypothetical protein CRG98_001485 [Punica granatum]
MKGNVHELVSSRWLRAVTEPLTSSGCSVGTTVIGGKVHKQKQRLKGGRGRKPAVGASPVATNPPVGVAGGQQ